MKDINERKEIVVNDGANNAGMGRNIKLLQVHTICVGSVFVLPVLIPYYRDVAGLGFHEFMIGEAVFSTVMIMMEIPTGWLSDVWGRKRTLIASAIAELIGWTLLLTAHSFEGTVAGQAVLGIGVSLMSGTNSALLYDSLQALGREGEYRRREGSRQGTGLYAVAMASVLGGLMYQIDPRLPMIAVIIGQFLGLLAVLGMREPARHVVVEREAKHPIADMLETFRYAIHGHAEIAGIILLAAILFSGTKMMLWSQQPYYMALGLPEKIFGMLTAVGFVLGGTVSALGHRLDGRLGNTGTLRILSVWAVIACAAAGVMMNVYAIPLLLSGSLVFGLGWSRVQAAINESSTTTDRRATILSSASFMVHIFSIPLMVLTGWVTDQYGINYSLLSLAAVLTVGGLVSSVLMSLRQRRKLEKEEVTA